MKKIWTLGWIKSCWVMCLLLLLPSCTTTSSGTEAALQIVTLPIRIVFAAVGALIGAAAGMGYFPG